MQSSLCTSLYAQHKIIAYFPEGLPVQEFTKTLCTIPLQYSLTSIHTAELEHVLQNNKLLVNTDCASDTE